MANHCWNHITIEGSKKDLEAIHKEFNESQTII